MALIRVRDSVSESLPSLSHALFIFKLNLVREVNFRV